MGTGNDPPEASAEPHFNGTNFYEHGLSTAGTHAEPLLIASPDFVRAGDVDGPGTLNTTFGSWRARPTTGLRGPFSGANPTTVRPPSRL